MAFCDHDSIWEPWAKPNPMKPQRVPPPPGVTQRGVAADIGSDRTVENSFPRGLSGREPCVRDRTLGLQDPMNYFNAHCHLELGWLRGRIPPGLPFCEWLARVVAEKRAVDPAVSAASAIAGIEEMRRTGTTAFGDVLSMDTAATAILGAVDMKRIAFIELIEFAESRAEAAVTRGLARGSSLGGSPSPTVGLSPHAPYTTTGALLKAAAREAEARCQWLCIHAAETPEETELLERGTGPMRELLAAPIAESGWAPPMMRPIAWLDACGALGPRTLLVHLNDATDEELRLIAARGCSAVVCPGTHVYFRRGEFPLARLLDAGIPTYLGTDSLASNDSLDMGLETMLAVMLCPSVDFERVLAIAHAGRAARFLK